MKIYNRIFVVVAALAAMFACQSEQPVEFAVDSSEKVGLKLYIPKTKIMASGPITSWEIDGETVSDFIFGAPKSLQMVIVAMKLKDICSLEGKL